MISIKNCSIILFLILLIQFGCDSSNNSPTSSDPPSTTFGTVKGTVTEVGSNNPISGVIVSCGGITATTITDGKYQLDNIPSGQQTLTATKSGYELYSQSVNIESGTITKNIVLTANSSNANLEGTITDSETNQPLFNVKVTVAGMTDYTDGSGHYQFSSVPVGQQTISAQLADYDNFEGLTNITSGNKTYDIVMTLKMPRINNGTANGLVVGSITQYYSFFGVLKDVPVSQQNLLKIWQVSAQAIGVRDAKGIQKVELEYRTSYLTVIHRDNSLEIEPYFFYATFKKELNKTGSDTYSISWDFYENPLDLSNIMGSFEFYLLDKIVSPKLIVTDTDGNTKTLTISW